jgi:hypothetical protein
MDGDPNRLTQPRLKSGPGFGDVHLVAHRHNLLHAVVLASLAAISRSCCTRFASGLRTYLIERVAHLRHEREALLAFKIHFGERLPDSAI